MENFVCLCTTCPCFDPDDNFDNYLCDDCDPFAYDYDFEDEEEGDYENE